MKPLYTIDTSLVETGLIVDILKTARKDNIRKNLMIYFNNNKLYIYEIDYPSKNFNTEFEFEADGSPGALTLHVTDVQHKNLDLLIKLFEDLKKEDSIFQHGDVEFQCDDEDLYPYIDVTETEYNYKKEIY